VKETLFTIFSSFVIENMLEKKITELKVGVLGGGQLGKMLSVAASSWSIDLELMDHEKGILKKGVAARLHYGDIQIMIKF